MATAVISCRTAVPSSAGCQGGPGERNASQKLNPDAMKKYLFLLFIFIFAGRVNAQEVEFETDGLYINSTLIDLHENEEIISALLGEPDRIISHGRVGEYWYYDDLGMMFLFDQGFRLLILQFKNGDFDRSTVNDFSGTLKIFELEIDEKIEADELETLRSMTDEYEIEEINIQRTHVEISSFWYIIDLSFSEDEEVLQQVWIEYEYLW